MDIRQSILKNISWEDLPESLTSELSNNPLEYDNNIIVYSFKLQLRYHGNLIQKVIKSEKSYYRQLIDYSQSHMMLYPYHLQAKLVPGLQITPFTYYFNIVREVLISERSYDSIPNFTAADCVRLMGIGRNQYIDLMNTFKSQIATLGRDQAIGNIPSIMPEMALDIPIEPWFTLGHGALTKADFESLNSEDRQLIDRVIDVCDAGQSLSVGDCGRDSIFRLFRKGFLFFDVPVEDGDRVSVPTLDNFVMNRVSGDHCETLLYQVFVSVDPNSTVAELAQDMNQNLELVRHALSLFCRLGFAVKRTKADEGTASDRKKMAFLFDSTLTAYLMMGNLSPTLKRHAVTMFEVGRLTGESLDGFLEELDALNEQNADGEARTYFMHAVSLRQTIHFLRDHVEELGYRSLDLIRCESLLVLDEAARSSFLKKHFDLLVSMSPITWEDRQLFSPEWPPHLGSPSPLANSPWFRLFIAQVAASNVALPSLMFMRGYRLTAIPECLLPFSRCLVTSWGHDPVIMSTTTMLMTVNDLLLANPVLVQAFDTSESESNQMDLCLLPLPLSQQTVKKLLPTKSNSLINALGNLHSVVPLDMVLGYLTFVPQVEVLSYEMEEQEDQTFDKVSSAEEAHENSSTNDFLDSSHVLPSFSVLEENELNESDCRTDLRLLSMELGVPLFDRDISQLILQQTLDHKARCLLKREMNKKVHKVSKDLARQVDDFVAETGAIPMNTKHIPLNVLTADAAYKTHIWPNPVKNIIIDGSCPIKNTL